MTRIFKLKKKELNLHIQDRILKSPKLWNLLCDLEESLGNYESTKNVYCRMMEISVCSPQTILNFASFLDTNGHIEEAFQVYERGLKIFRYPHSKDIWHAYIDKFISWCKSSKIEMIRDLFEHALTTVPMKESTVFYLKYAEIEEKFGTPRRAMQIYERAANAASRDEKMRVYVLYIKKAKKNLGLAKMREVFENAIEAKGQFQLKDEDVVKLCISYAQLELKLGEVDRVRAIYNYASQISPIEWNKNVFEKWNQFEIAHGNEDTFKDMLRIKRSVECMS